ncbi:MAG: acylneuraminate cytidylyltransferase family protein [Candidatus Methanoperedens sp.]
MVIAIIPARGGSKGVPKKNIRKLGGYPLIAYSIIACRLSKKIDRTIVSTDSVEIAEIAKFFGAEVPFLRPAEISRDSSKDIEFIEHAINWFKKNEGKIPEYLVQIRPTTPLREPELIDTAIVKMIDNSQATSLRSVHEIRESPYKLFGIEDDFLVGLYPDDPRPEYYNLPRQNFPSVYQPNGYVDIIKSETVLKLKSLHGPKILSFMTPNTGEIDTPDDFDYIEYMLSKNKYKICEFLKSNY